MQNRQDDSPSSRGSLIGQSAAENMHRRFHASTCFRRYWLFLVLIAALIAGALVCILPLPPAQVTLATGPAGSAQRQLSEKFRDYFARHGVELALVDSTIREQAQQKPKDGDPRPNAGFLIAGAVTGPDVPGLLSLGSVQYAPFWMFYRGDAFAGGDPLRALAAKRVSIGFEGSSARNILVKLQALADVSFARKDNLFELTHQDAVERFIAGAIDAVFIVDGVDSPTIQKLIAAPRAQLYAFNLIDAYAGNLPFLTKVEIPRGALNLRSVFPPTPTTMLASSVSLVVEKDLHPAIQWLFIRAAREIGGQSNQIVSRPGLFPAHLDQAIALSPVAQRYYDLGRLPVAFDILPWQLAALDARLWLALPAVVVLLLLLNLLVGLRRSDNFACPPYGTEPTSDSPQAETTAMQATPVGDRSGATGGNAPARNGKTRGSRK